MLGQDSDVDAGSFKKIKLARKNSGFKSSAIIFQRCWQSKEPRLHFLHQVQTSPSSNFIVSCLATFTENWE